MQNSFNFQVKSKATTLEPTNNIEKNASKGQNK